jgi:MFS family permease
LASVAQVKRRANAVFYGWWVVAAGFVVQLMNGALLFHSFTAYFVFLQAEFGWSRTTLAGAFSLTRVESGLLGPIEGWLVDRFGPRAVMRIGILVFGSGFIALSMVNSILTFYLAFSVMAVGSALAGFLPASTAVANWFLRRRATAMGIMMTGMGMGGLLVPLVTLSLSMYGWRATAFVSGVVIITVGLPAIQLMRHRPEDYGEVPDGVAQPQESSAGHSAQTYGLTARQALRTRGFWFLSLGHSIALLVVGATMVHQMPHRTESGGLSVELAGAVVALMMGIVVVGQLAGGPIGDRMNKRVGIAICMVLHSVALIIFAVLTNVVGAVLFALLNGVAWGVRGPLLNAIRADYFGRVAFGTIMGFSSLIIMTGMTLGPIFAGAMADWLGDYSLAFIILAVVCAAGALVFLFASPPTPEPRSVRQDSAA